MEGDPAFRDTWSTPIQDWLKCNMYWIRSVDEVTRHEGYNNDMLYISDLISRQSDRFCGWDTWIEALQHLPDSGNTMESALTLALLLHTQYKPILLQPSLSHQTISSRPHRTPQAIGSSYTESHTLQTPLYSRPLSFPPQKPRMNPHTPHSNLSKCSNLVNTTCLLVSSISPARNTSSRIAYTCSPHHHY